MKNDELRALVAKVRTMQSEGQNTCTALDSTKQQLAYVTEQHSQTTAQISNCQVIVLNISAYLKLYGKGKL